MRVNYERQLFRFDVDRQGDKCRDFEAISSGVSDLVCGSELIIDQTRVFRCNVIEFPRRPIEQIVFGILSNLGCR